MRIPDVERIKSLLEGEGGSLGRRAIMESLGLSDQRYEEVADQLVVKRLAVKNRGRAGGLRLLELTTTNAAASLPQHAERSLERDLYPPFAAYLRTAAEHDNGRSVVLDTYRTRARKWETPDLTEVRVTPFPMIGQWELRVVTYELKRAEQWGIESVLQTATYNEFSHESWLVVQASDDREVDFGKRVVDTAGGLGIGLASFDADARTLRKYMTPVPKRLPLLSRLHEWLESTIEGIGDDKLKALIADNIRWAHGKAQAGKD